LIRFILPFGWLIISTILLTLPGTSFPKEDWLDKIWFDKWVHLGLFLIMVVIWSRMLSGWAINKSKSSRDKKLHNPLRETRSKKSIYFFIAFIFLLYGVVMEFIQHYLIPNRSFDAGDIIADAAGCGLGFVYSSRRYIKK